jgi:hypothetical protein
MNEIFARFRPIRGSPIDRISYIWQLNNKLTPSFVATFISPPCALTISQANDNPTCPCPLVWNRSIINSDSSHHTSIEQSLFPIIITRYVLFFLPCSDTTGVHASKLGAKQKGETKY